MIIVNELALNSLKPRPRRERGVVAFPSSSKVTTGNYFRIRFADSGAGLPDDFDPTTCRGLGLRIVSSLAPRTPRFADRLFGRRRAFHD